MKKAEKNKQKKRIIALLESLDWMFSIQNYTREINFHKEASTENEMIGARVTFNEEYAHIRVEIFPLFFDETPEDQRKMILHELCHTITIPSKKIACNLQEGKLVTPEEIHFINERTTTQIENLLDKLLKGNLKYAKDAYKKYLK